MEYRIKLEVDGGAVWLGGYEIRQRDPEGVKMVNFNLEFYFCKDDINSKRFLELTEAANVMAALYEILSVGDKNGFVIELEEVKQDITVKERQESLVFGMCKAIVEE